VVIFLLYCITFAFVKYYQDKDDTMEFLPTFVVMSTLVICLLSVLLLPFDVFVVSYREPDGAYPDREQVTDDQDLIRAFYITIYSLIIAMCYLVIPFTYFYFEAADSDELGRDAPPSVRAREACKYTTCFLFVIVLMIVIGLILTGGKLSGDAGMVGQILRMQDSRPGEGMLMFIIACLVSIGILGWFTYTAQGMCSMPVYLWQWNMDDSSGERSEVAMAYEKNDQKLKAAQNKSALGGKKSEKQRQAEARLRGKATALRNRQEALDRQDFRQKIFMACVPFSKGFAVVSGILSFLIFISILMGAIFKLIQGQLPGGAWIMQYHQAGVPMDALLMWTSHAFPIDYIILLCLSLYVFFVTIRGLINIGIRCMCCIKMFDLVGGETEPQALLIATFMLCHVMLTFSMEMQTLAPQYTAFGTQTYCNSTLPPGFKPQPTALLKSESITSYSQGEAVTAANKPGLLSPKVSQPSATTLSAGAMLLEANNTNYTNHTVVQGGDCPEAERRPCDWSVAYYQWHYVDPPHCKLTVLAQLMNSISLRYSFFAQLFFLTSFLFVALTILWATCEVFCPMCRPQPENEGKYGRYEDDDDEKSGCSIQ